MLPLLAFPVLRACGRFGRADAASLAAHYGSVSVATFAVGVSLFSPSADRFVRFSIAAIPRAAGNSRDRRRCTARARTAQRAALGNAAARDLLGKSIVLLVGGLAIGWAAGAEGIAPLEPLFFDLFKGVLALFLLEMGLIASSQVQVLRQKGLVVAALGILAPVPLGAVGAFAGWMMGLSVGGTTLLAVLAGSASYIAAPAAMRIAVPEANPSLSLTASLGVTFPFNIFVGIPTYYSIATAFTSLGRMRPCPTQPTTDHDITEAILEVELCEVLEQLGATGYTVTNARGSGHRGIRDAGWSSSSNVRIEVVCKEDVAQRIAPTPAATITTTTTR